MIGLLKKRYAPPGWAFVEEVSNATGANPTARRCDGLAMALWPSLGLELHGFEVKTSRGDWLRELRDDEKAAAFFGYFDRWWLVVSDAKIVKKEELPATWGLLVLRGKQLVSVVPAPKLEALPMSRSFFAAICHAQRRSFSKEASVLREPVAKQLVEEFRRGREQGEANASQQAKHVKDAHDRLTVAIETFEKETGIPLGSERYRIPRLGKIVRTVIANQDAEVEYNRLRSRLERLLASMDEVDASSRALGGRE